MEVMKSGSENASEHDAKAGAESPADVKPADSPKENVFSDKLLAKDSEVPDPRNGDRAPIKISAADKVAFMDSVVGNTRFTKEYSLFGGRLKVTMRSLTSDEVNALAVWTAKQGTKDAAGMMAGRYRKYLLAASIAMLNGVEMPPLEEPLYETLHSDGKTTVPPGWVKRCDYFDGMGFAQFQALVNCAGEFDMLYSLLCREAEDANFWNPDTP